MTIFLTEQDAARLGLSDAKPRRPAKAAREARPNLPRAAAAARGDGDRLEALGRLAAAGWTCTNYLHSTGEYWVTHRDGRTTPRTKTYREMIDGALAIVREA